MEEHREQLPVNPANTESTPHSVNNAMQELFDSANAPGINYSAAERAGHIGLDDGAHPADEAGVVAVGDQVVVERSGGGRDPGWSVISINPATGESPAMAIVFKDEDGQLKRKRVEVGELAALQAELAAEQDKPAKLDKFVHQEKFGTIKYAEDAPTLDDILMTPAASRSQELTGNSSKGMFKDPHEQTTMTEHEAVSGLKEFATQLKRYSDADLAKFGDGELSSVDEEAREKCKAFSAFAETLRYVGGEELQKACEGIAGRWHDLIEGGDDVYVYHQGHSSGRYMAIKTMEEFTKLTEDNTEARSHIKISNNSTRIAAAVASGERQSHVIVVDDFSVTGTEIKAFMTRMGQALTEHGISTQNVSEIIEGNLVGVGKTQEGQRPRFMVKVADGQPLQPIPVYAYYLAPANKEVHGGVSFTGSHSSTDHGVVILIEQAAEYLKGKGQSIDYVLPVGLVRPYAHPKGAMLGDAGSSGFGDSKLQDLNDRMEAQYGLNTQFGLKVS